MGFTMQARVGLSQHFLFGFFTTFLVALSQSMTMFYFIGTGKQVKDLAANLAGGKELIQRTKMFKARVFPPATWAILFTMATMILGGGVDTRVIPPFVHLVLAAIALYYNIVSFVREARYMIQHNMLMEELDRMLNSAAANE